LNKLKQTTMAVVVAIGMGLTDISQAALSVGNGLVYDTVQNSTWTQDANLLGTMEANDPNLVSKIIDANNGIVDFNNPITGTHILSATLDFNDGGSVHGNGVPTGPGTVDFWGALAFVGYLNSIDYKGSTQWSLPTTPINTDGYNQISSQLGELFYNELGGVDGLPMPVGPFNNVQNSFYWSGTQSSLFYFDAFGLYTSSGYQTVYNKNIPFYAWAVSPGDITAVPVPSTVWLFGTGLLGFLGIKRQANIQLIYHTDSV
jgi:hypothetical protein